MKKWGVYELLCGIHIIPEDDLREHIPNASCECNPVFDDENQIFTHRSYDKREKVEELLWNVGLN